ncbi:MAG: TRAP transporter large permease [Bacillota bacterium]
MTTVLLVFLGLLLVFFIAGFAVPYAIGVTSVVALAVQRGVTNMPVEMIAQRLVYGVNNFTILAIPFFLLAGKLMNTGGITRRIFRFANILVGYLPGGLGHANIVASMIFAGMSGSAVADAAGLGTIEVEAMLEHGYDRDFSAAVTAASSTIGPIIPPSIPLVMYGVMGNVSVSALLIGGLVPGILMGASLMAMVAWYAFRRKWPREKVPSLSEFWKGFKEAFWPLLTPAILVGGILSGIFTPTEASAVCVAYALILCVVVYREVGLTELYRVLVETVKETAVILFIIAAASLYGWLLIRSQIPMFLAEEVFAISRNPLVILLILNLFFIAVGCFMESLAAITILTPVLVPLAMRVGIDPLHLGLVMVLNLMIGLLTPPVGMCLYAVSRVAKIPFERMVRVVLPFYVPLFFVLLLITVFPKLVTVLPAMVLGR